MVYIHGGSRVCADPFDGECTYSSRELMNVIAFVTLGVDACPQSNNCDSVSRQMTRLAGHQMRSYYHWAAVAREKVCGHVKMVPRYCHGMLYMLAS